MAELTKAVADVATAVLALEAAWPVDNDDTTSGDLITVTTAARLLDALAGTLSPRDHRAALRHELEGRTGR